MGNSFLIHFVYGSKPKKEFLSDEGKVPGGLLGGHIFIQSGENVYGFESTDRKRIHIFPHRRFNSIFKKEHLNDWKKATGDQKMTSIEIPVEMGIFRHLDSILENFNNQTPYDYAVFGMRCGSSTYQILSELGFFPVGPEIIAIFRIPYPGILRKKMLRMAEANNYSIKLQPGNDKRTWEKE